jgi:hypothetical protein
MYRGDRPSDLYRPLINIDHQLLNTKYGTLRMTELKLTPERIKKSYENKKVSFLIKLKYENKQIFKTKISLGEVKKQLKTDFAFVYLETNPPSIHFLDVDVFYEEKASSVAKLLAGLTSCKPKNYLRVKFFVPETDKIDQRFKVSLFDKENNEYILSILYEVRTKILKTLNLTFTKETFVDIQMKNILKQYSMFDGLKYNDFNENYENCFRAQHKAMINYGNSESVQFYFIEILHIASLKWSSIKIMLDNHIVLATSHLVGSEQLALPGQVNNEKCLFSLDPKYEKAMLIRNSNGDYASIKGKWVESLSKLQVTWYSFETKSIIQQFYISNDLTFEINNSVLSTIDLNTGRVDLYFGDADKKIEAVSSLALIFSVMVLYVLLVPKPKPYLNKDLKKIFEIDYKKYHSHELNRDSLLSLIGFTELIASPSFYYNYADKPPAYFKNDGWLFGDIEKD